MTTNTVNDTLEQPLIPVLHSEGWRGGLGNLIRKEFGQWWGTRSWWIQTLIWLILLNGVTTLVMLEAPMTAGEMAGLAVQTFLLVGATAIGIGVVLSIQGAVVGEKELGTAAWVMSKPASRASFVLAKLLANTVGFLVTAVAIPSIVFIVQARLLTTAPLDYTPFALGVAVVALSVVFYVVLTIALGCMFKGRGPVAGIGIGLILVGQFFKESLPLSVVLVTPWLLGDVASSVALASPPDFNRMVPIIVTAVATVALTFVAVWRFGREEF
jgi:ABC-2 type transport system permease protein